MEGGIELSEGTIYELLEVLLKNIERPADARRHPSSSTGIRIALKRLDQYNPVGKAKANVAHHYDLSGALYDLFLDRDRQYSCAYFETPDASLEDAQLAKKRHLAAKLNIKPGMKVLDIGSGWGGLGLYLAETCGAQGDRRHALGRAAQDVDRAGARSAASPNTVDFRLLDYRLLDEPFDRIVSVGMFEHVGVGHYKEFFRKCRALLKDDGIAVLHSINRSDGPGATSAWTKKYIFPGGYVPGSVGSGAAYREAAASMSPTSRSCGCTMPRPCANGASASPPIAHRAKAIYDERFCRMWEFYLAAPKPPSAIPA